MICRKRVRSVRFRSALSEGTPGGFVLLSAMRRSVELMYICYVQCVLWLTRLNQGQ